MRLIDLYFRAFRAFRKYTQHNTDSQKQRKVITHANMKEDQLTSIKYTCEIDEDWIENIEEGLIYIEKAIREERQFIRSEGEVVNIEKVKRTSKATVEHLARHSGLITRLPKNDGDPIIPDKLYIVEKLSDYTVYENKFLYMLLSYLKDFIHLRIDKIRSKMTTYQANMIVRKEIRMNDRHINYHLVYSDLNHNDPYLIDVYQQFPLVTRIETIYSLVISLLSTPLMKEVSKVPMIKPPIVKTNTLRMNQNFKAALLLYDYISSYSKDGYSFKEVKKTYNPFPDEMSDEFAEIIELTSLISYKFGNDVKMDLIERYDIEEKKIKEQEVQKSIEEIKRLKKRINEMNEDPAEYILKLEKRNRDLEKDNVELALEKQKNKEYQLQIINLEKEKQGLNVSIKNLHSELEQKNDEINALNRKYFDDMTMGEKIHRQEMAQIIEQTNQRINRIQENHQKFVQELRDQQQQEINVLNEEHLVQKSNLVEQHNQQIIELNNQHSNELAQLHQHHEYEQENLVNKFEEIITSLKNQIQEINKNIENLQIENNELISQNQETITNYESHIKELEIKVQQHEDGKRSAMGKFHALKYQQGLFTEEDDFTSKEKFLELELEMTAYKKFFKEQWKKTKKRIREEAKEAALANTDKK